MGQAIRHRFAQRLRELRKKNKLTQQRLAELADLDYKHVQRLESKDPTDVKLESIERLAKAFRIKVSKLLSDPFPC